jgi:hypothetical protein
MTTESRGDAQSDALQDGQPKRSAEDIARLTASIMARARHSVDPHRTGFEPTMSFAEWQWGEENERLLTAFLAAFVSIGTRLCYAIISAGAAIGAGIMFGSESGGHFAGLTLLVAAAAAAAVAFTSYRETTTTTRR